eukprot:m.70783 g.70783  ORF g.70783 m.70783 type:complete len:1094 (-) comp12268_c2_seq1:291-3572(-)
MEELVGAANILMGVVSASQQDISMAEQVFLSFKAQANPYADCFNYLASTRNEYVAFECFQCITEALVREWNTLDAETVTNIRQQALAYLRESPAIPEFVIQQALSAITSSFKMAWSVQGVNAHFHAAYYEMVEEMMQADNEQEILLGLRMCVAMLNDVASARGITWDFHCEIRKCFEREEHLIRHFTMALSALQRVMEAPSHALMSTALQICDLILNWQFLSGMAQRLGAFSQVESILFRGGKQWAGFFTSDVSALLFSVYEAVREEEDLNHTCLQCLVKLGSLPSSCFPDSQAVVAYTNAFVTQLGHAVALVVAAAQADVSNVAGQELHDMTSVISLAIVGAEFDVIMTLPSETQQLLLSSLGDLSALALHMMTSEIDDDPLCSEAFDNCLSAWVVFRKPGGNPEWRTHFGHVFSQYVDSRMVKAERDALDDTEIPDELEEDCVMYSEQLEGAAVVGRMQFEVSLAYIQQQFEKHLGAYTEMLTQDPAAVDQAALAISHEQCHWLLLIAAYFVSDSFAGEIPCVAPEILLYQEQVETQGGESAFVALCTSLLEFSNFESQLRTSPAAVNLSPQVASSLLVLLARWSSTYLLIEPEDRAREEDVVMSPDLVARWSLEHGQGAQIQEQLLQKVAHNLKYWQGEPYVIEKTVDLLDALTASQTQRMASQTSENLWGLAAAFATEDSELSHIAHDLQGKIAQAVCKVCAATEAVEDMKQRLGQIIDPCTERLTGLLENPALTANPDAPEAQAAVSRSLQVLSGVFRSTSCATAALLAQKLLPFLESIVALYRLYAHSYVTSTHVISLMYELANSWLTPAIHEGKCPDAIEHYYNCVQMLVTEWSTAFQAESGQQFSAEEKLETLSQMLEIIKELAVCELFDGSFFSDSGPAPSGAAAVGHGLIAVLTVTPLEFLQVPTLANLLFRTLDSACEAFPVAFYSADATFWERLVAALEFGLQTVGDAVQRCSLSTLQTLATTHLESQEKVEAFVGVAHNFMQGILQWFVLETFDMQLLDLASTTLFALICIDVNQFQQLAQSLVEQRCTDETQQQRLNAAFTKLLTDNNLQLDYTRAQKPRFTKNFAEFLVDVRGCLLVT